MLCGLVLCVTFGLVLCITSGLVLCVIFGRLGSRQVNGEDDECVRFALNLFTRRRSLPWVTTSIKNI